VMGDAVKGERRLANREGGHPSKLATASSTVG
jgi:hypothetical protein